MLIIVTGVPGSGKTLFSLDRILKMNVPQKGDQPRPVYVNGVPDLDYRFFGARELEDAKTWHDCPEGSIIMIDECQRVFPQRKAGAEVPEFVELLSRHRHKGFDVILVSQDAMNVDVFVRRMCGRHYHVHRVLNREVATVYEFDKFESNPTGYHEKKQAVSVSPWKYPKKLFERYKSATMHTYKARMPWKLVALPLVAIASVALLWYGIDSVMSRADEVEELASSQPGAAAPPRIEHTVLASPFTVEGYTQLYKPVVPGLLHTAPVYQEIFAEVETFPKPLCIEFEVMANTSLTKCRCYTQQMTQYETSDANCRYWVRNGFFDPTLSDEDLAAGARGEAEAHRAPPIH